MQTELTCLDYDLKASCLCSDLVEKPALVQGKRVLEIGAGTGLCGIVAAKLGAAQVILDCPPPNLKLLFSLYSLTFQHTIVTLNIRS